jgi:hypothetical protein
MKQAETIRRETAVRVRGAASPDGSPLANQRMRRSQHHISRSLKGIINLEVAVNLEVTGKLEVVVKEFRPSDRTIGVAQ